ncbi:acetylcholinesterase-like [Xenia sp. Carnegie-2017]|uniref:acetylcholinesterase-like n=1 Tax=Xenia sp. Carnegie-2017 TaxID=2897299 RepID=UPI001F049940|nr:acetylcholinesterase-like [Xenia sp. Carnegie-2017]
MYSKLILLLVIIHISTIDSKSTNAFRMKKDKDRYVVQKHFISSLFRKRKSCISTVKPTTKSSKEPLVSTAKPDDSLVVETNTGNVQGFIEESSFPGKRIQKFLNIPYAEPPLGNLRFERPKEIKKPCDDKVCNSQPEEKISCLQAFFAQVDDNLNQTEDCLILNVWTPYPRPKNASVMIFINGFGFISGSSHEDIFIGSNFVAMGDVILVTLNYRLSVLGFLSDAEKESKKIRNEIDDDLSRNIGLFDQRLAMKWVKKNIAAFGGNPSNITLFGQGAGSVCVSAHTLSPESWDYFDRVILESGNMLMYWSMSQTKEREDKTRAFLKAVGCDNCANTKKCLQENVTSEELQKYIRTEDFMFTPDVDGDFFKDHPRFLFVHGKGKQCPTIFGTVKDEMFITTSHIILNETRSISQISAIFNKTLRGAFSNHARFYEVAHKLYSSECTSSLTEAYRPLVNFLTDWAFTCPVKEEAFLRARFFPKQPVYVYRYAYASAVPLLYPKGTFGFVAHGMDLPFVFGLPFKKPLYSKEDRILSARMILYFTNFAKTGNPNMHPAELPKHFKDIDQVDLPDWPRHTIDKEKYIKFEGFSKVEVEHNLRQKYCEFWDAPMYAIYRSKYF